MSDERPAAAGGADGERVQISVGPLPASTKEYVPGKLFPRIRVPMRRIALSHAPDGQGTGGVGYQPMKAHGLETRAASLTVYDCFWSLHRKRAAD